MHLLRVTPCSGRFEYLEFVTKEGTVKWRVLDMTLRVSNLVRRNYSGYLGPWYDLDVLA